MSHLVAHRTARLRQVIGAREQALARPESFPALVGALGCRSPKDSRRSVCGRLRTCRGNSERLAPQTRGMMPLLRTLVS